MGARASQRFERELARRGLDLNWSHHIPAAPAADDNFYDALVVRAWFPRKEPRLAWGKTRSHRPYRRCRTDGFKVYP